VFYRRAYFGDGALGDAPPMPEHKKFGTKMAHSEPKIPPMVPPVLGPLRKILN